MSSVSTLEHCDTLASTSSSSSTPDDNRKTGVGSFYYVAGSIIHSCIELLAPYLDANDVFHTIVTCTGLYREDMYTTALIGMVRTNIKLREVITKHVEERCVRSFTPALDGNHTYELVEEEVTKRSGKLYTFTYPLPVHIRGKVIHCCVYHKNQHYVADYVIEIPPSEELTHAILNTVTDMQVEHRPRKYLYDSDFGLIGLREDVPAETAKRMSAVICRDSCGRLSHIQKRRRKCDSFEHMSDKGVFNKDVSMHLVIIGIKAKQGEHRTTLGWDVKWDFYNNQQRLFDQFTPSAKRIHRVLKIAQRIELS